METIYTPLSASEMKTPRLEIRCKFSFHFRLHCAMVPWYTLGSVIIAFSKDVRFSSGQADIDHKYFTYEDVP